MTLQESFENIKDERIDRCKKTQSRRYINACVCGSIVRL